VTLLLRLLVCAKVFVAREACMILNFVRPNSCEKFASFERKYWFGTL
jgi:hypothetical protein